MIGYQVGGCHRPDRSLLDEGMSILYFHLMLFLREFLEKNLYLKCLKPIVLELIRVSAALSKSAELGLKNENYNKNA